MYVIGAWTTGYPNSEQGLDSIPHRRYPAVQWDAGAAPPEDSRKRPDRRIRAV